MVILVSKINHFYVQVSYLKDTISRKDMEIDQLLKDKAKSPSSSTDRNDSSQQIRRLSGKIYVLVANFHYALKIISVVNGISNGPTSLSNIGAGGSTEAECEDNMSDDGCSIAGTECSVGGASEATAERMYVANFSTFHILSLIKICLLQYHILFRICWAYHNSVATYVSAANNLPFFHPFN